VRGVHFSDRCLALARKTVDSGNDNDLDLAKFRRFFPVKIVFGSALWLFARTFLKVGRLTQNHTEL
jgi:hypothetical protein